MLDEMESPEPQGDHGADEQSGRPSRKTSVRTLCIVVAVFLSATCGGAAVLRYASYEAGAANNAGAIFAQVALFLLLLGVLGAVVIVLGLITLYFWMRGRADRPALLRPGVFIVGLLGLAAGFVISGPTTPVFLAGFGKWVSTNMDVAAVQQWLATDGPKYAGRSFSTNFPSDFPKALTEREPRSIAVDTGTDGDLTIRFCWPGGLGDLYGVVVGPATMKMPRTGRNRAGRGTTEFQRPVGAGAYVFYGG